MMKQALTLLIVLIVTALPAGAETCLCEAEPEPIEIDWLDRSHDALLMRTQRAAIWFDQFFGDRRDEDELATMRTRITLGWEPSQHDGNNSYARVRVKVRLPNLKEHFDLLLSNEEVDDYNLLPLEANRPQEAADTTEDNYNAALRWIKRTTVKETIDARVGLRSGPNIYLMGRHRRYHNLTKHVKLRLTPAVFIDSEYGTGIRLLNELDYLFDHPGLIRFSARGQFSDKSNGLEWRGGLSYVYRLSKTGAVVGGFYLSGETDAKEDVENYSTSVRLRNQFWRPYLFYEIEPFIDWPADDGYRTNSGIALRIQMVIGK